MSSGLSYKGYVKYADDSVISIQCFEDRCTECPDEVPDGEGGGRGVLDGYNCEHGCGHGPASKRTPPQPGPESCSVCGHISQRDTFPVDVRFAYPDAGYPAGNERAKRLLKPGGVYTIRTMEVGQSEATLTLQGLPGHERFSSVYFEPYWEDDETAGQPGPESCSECGHIGQPEYWHRTAEHDTCRCRECVQRRSGTER